MKGLLFALILVSVAGGAVAQTKPAPPVNMSGTAGVKTHLQALHYKDVHDLRRGYDGQWVGTASTAMFRQMVTIAPDGTVTAR